MKTMPISEAKLCLNRMDELLKSDQVITVVRHKAPVFALVDIEYLESATETIEILCDPHAVAMLQESIEEIREGKIVSHEAVEAEL